MAAGPPNKDARGRGGFPAASQAQPGFLAREHRAVIVDIGMVGSTSKRGTFLHHLYEKGMPRSAVDRLVLPIGGSAVDDKRPDVIAAMTASDVLLAFAEWRHNNT